MRVRNSSKVLLDKSGRMQNRTILPKIKTNRIKNTKIETSGTLIEERLLLSLRVSRWTLSGGMGLTSGKWASLINRSLNIKFLPERSSQGHFFFSGIHLSQHWMNFRRGFLSFLWTVFLTFWSGNFEQIDIFLSGMFYFGCISFNTKLGLFSGLKEFPLLEIGGLNILPRNKFKDFGLPEHSKSFTIGIYGQISYEACWQILRVVH